MNAEYLALYDKQSKYIDELNQNLLDCTKEFEQTFGSNQELISVCAPGRVNLIGEHIDYNDGFVLPMAIPLYTVIVGARNNSDQNNNQNKLCRVKSLESSLGENNLIEFSLNDLKKRDRSENWANYIIGVVANFEGNAEPFDIVIKSNVPLGSGLSSSAALEVSVYTFIENLTNQFSAKEKKALCCQKAEHIYASVPCGIMDQFISSMGQEGHALLIDCRSYESKAYPIKDPDTSILVINSNVKHQLEGSEYSSRRKQCEDVARIIGKKSLRDASMQDLEDKKSQIDDESYRRARHAITEIARTIDASNALESNNLVLFGQLMNLSHDSLRDDFNVSCAELDSLVNIARQSNGVLGSRMTGGGFGGCTVTLVKTEHVNEVIENVKKNYKGTASFYVCKPCEGARKI
ncbi:unnamed protein product [Brachionus calyciflorus]|uniref:Galactokinase n=1 Tax=Brachionus calyciflorus TaxID=104777 RepID=A0A813M049_9BILA|nr:unnamed protein product [Brachionus calyciflorus]